jgi:Uma2 family endonuclease
MKTVEPPKITLEGAQVWPMSVAAYRSLGEAGFIPKNSELLYGIIYKKMSKSPPHSAIVRRLLKLLQAISLPGRFVSSEQPITCEDSEPEPDISIVRGGEEDFWDEHPGTAELVIEVCVTSHEFDRLKLRAYANAMVKECWLVLVPEKKIEVYRAPVEGQFSEQKTFGPGGRLKCGAVPEFVVELDKLFAK